MKIFTKRRIWAACGVFLAFVLVREVIFRGPQAAVSQLRGYKIIYPLDTASELFLHDKTMMYDVVYNSVAPIGRLTITTRRTEEGVDLRASVTTQGTPIGSLLKARAEISSLLDPVTFAPRQYKEFTEVKGKKKIKIFQFDYENLLMREGERIVSIDEDVRDVLSAFFMLLSQTPSRETLTSTFISKRELYTITMTPLGQKRTAAAYQVDIQRANKTSNHGGRFSVWVAKNSTRTPVLFKSWTPVGYFSVILTEIRSDEKEPETQTYEGYTPTPEEVTPPPKEETS